MNKNFQLTSIVADNLEIGLLRYEVLPEKKFTCVNSTLLRLLEFRHRKSFFSIKLDDLFYDRKDLAIFFEILNRNDKIKLFEAALKTENGKKFWAVLTASYVFTKDNTKCIEAIIQDISYKKRIDSKLLMEKDLLQSLFENIPDAVYFKDKSNRIVKVNKFYSQGTGLKEDQILGKTDFDFFPFQQAKQMFDDDNWILNTGKPIVGKVEKTLLPSGTWNKVLTTKIPMHDKKGKIIGTMGTTRDMSIHANFEEQRINMVINALEVLGKALEMRDPYTFSHTRHVANISEKIARSLGWNENRCLAIKLAGELHDMGKISIPLDILNKPGKLSKLENSLIREHTRNCFNLMKDIKFPFPLAEIIYQHHERLDGSGYPRKLTADHILPEARIIAVSDVFEAMTHHRPYREALGIKQAAKELKSERGKKYDALYVDTLLKLVEANNDKPFWMES